MIGKTISHYRITSKLGAGGMGEVYRAHDERLERDVALKVLPAHTLADEVARKRFRKEALALSKLNHPNIATIYDFDTQDGVDFLVMEYVEGTTLSEKLSGHSLPEKEVAKIGGQVADALEEAHERGVVHRDLKPGNVMVTPKGHAKVLDFGLAKLVRPVSETEVTESLTEGPKVAGTLPYMAPEQLQGEEVDARTDIHALGLLLYEMSTGRRAFREELATRLTDAILHRAPVTPRAINARVSPELERIILKCLEKDPENRYQSAKEIGVDLRRLRTSASVSAVGEPIPSQFPWRRAVVASLVVVVLLAVVFALNVGGLRDRLLGTAAPARIESIAVLPLQNLSGDPEQEYFADGMTEALITNLSKIGALKVISRTSAMRYKGTDKSLPEIARELNVDAVVEGSALRVGDRVRITAQLIHAATDPNLWAESYNRDLRNILVFQSEVAQAIAQEIKIALTPEEQARLASARPVNPEAHELYLKGLYFVDRGPGGLIKANQYFQQAIESDPSYAQAYAGLAWSYMHMGHTNLRPPIEVLPKAKAAAMKAQELDEMLAETRITLATIKRTYERDWRGAEKEYELAIQLNPGYSKARVLYAWHLSLFGRHEEALAQAEQARSLAPVSIGANREFGRVLYWARRYDEAITQYRATIDLHPTDLLTHVYLMWAYFQKGMYKEAVAQFQESLTVGGANPEIVASVERAFELGGIKGALQWFLEFERARSKRRRISPGDFALLHALLDEKDQAFEWLEKAYREYDNWMFQLHDPLWDSLRPDPRFQNLLWRMNLSE